MVQNLIGRNACNMLRNNLHPAKTITNNFGMQNTINNLQLPCLPENNNSNFRNASSDSVMLRNLRLAVTPDFGQEHNSYDTVKSCWSTLAGDPTRFHGCCDIRAEILEKWNEKPKVEPPRNNWINVW